MLDGWIQGAEKLALPTPGYYSKSTLTVNTNITQDLMLVLHSL